MIEKPVTALQPYVPMSALTMSTNWNWFVWCWIAVKRRISRRNSGWYVFGFIMELGSLSIRLLWSVLWWQQPNGKPLPLGLVSCYRDSHFLLESCNYSETMYLIMLGTLGKHVLMKKRTDVIVRWVTIWLTALTVPAIGQCLTGRAVRRLWE